MSPPVDRIPPQIVSKGKTAEDAYLMHRAFDISTQSDDPKAAQYPASGVGAVIVLNSEIISESANRLVPKLRGKYVIDDPNSPERYYYIEHAERCAIYDALNRGIQIYGSDMYCTRFPCVDCARAISFAGIQRLVVPTGFASESRWIDAQRAALSLLRMSEITVRYFDPR